MPVPTYGWINGGWNNKLPHFRLLAEMVGSPKGSYPSPDELQGLLDKVASAKVFGENVQTFLEGTGRTKRSAADYLEGIEQKLGLMDPLPFMNLRGIQAPEEFDGVAIWPTGITNWTQLRLEQIQLAKDAGARFRYVVCLNSSRVCNTPADRRHPLIKTIPAGREPTEGELQQRIVDSDRYDVGGFIFPILPPVNTAGRPLSLEQQLKHFVESGQYADMIGGADIFVPSTPNSLYVPLHVRRVLGHDEVWFSQAGARLTRNMPSHWWPSLQDVMTIPNGIIRLWVELIAAGCINS